MTARKKTVDTEVVDLNPVELDPPDPALARWQEVTERVDFVYHGGDVEKIISFPRPAWADPEYDHTASIVANCLYQSAPAFVPAGRSHGQADDESIENAGIKVQSQIDGDGISTVKVLVRRTDPEGAWKNWSVVFYRDEINDLIEVLQAAVDLIGGAR